jgi:RNA polymerase sigma-70 factor (ECF subfamily)
VTQMPTELRDESRFVEALLRRDRAAFDTLIQSCWGAMWRTGKACGLSDALIEEMIQDTWAAVLKGLPTFERRSSVRTWVLRICARTCWRIARRERRMVPLEIPGDDGGYVDPDRFEPNGHWAAAIVPWADTTPEHIAGRREAMVALEAALQQLPTSQQVVVVMRDLDGLELEDIAETLELSVGNVRVLLHRGRARLRCALESVYVELRRR